MKTSKTEKITDELRYVGATVIAGANSGHTGVALGAAPIILALYKDHIILDRNNPDSPYRDRFVLSAGHASGLLYSALNLFDLGIKTEDLKKFRQTGSITPGHPEHGVTPFIDASTGPLGQGIAMAVGMAMAEEKNRHGSIDRNFTYVFCGDGCLMEGVALEAISLAGTLALERLIILYDYNQITIDGQLSIANTEKVKEKFVSQGFRVIECKNGNDADSVSAAITEAKKLCGKPTLIICPTDIGYGSKYANTCGIHGKALSKEDLAELKKGFEIAGEDYTFSPETKKHCLECFNKRQPDFKKMKNKSKFSYTPAQINAAFEELSVLKETPVSGRDASYEIMQKLSRSIPFFGGTADLAPSVKAYINSGGDFSVNCRNGVNIHFGVREHAMAAIANGIALHGENVAFTGTFLTFSNYLMPALRLSAQMKLPVIYIFSHDSVNVGEDGPTHQPVEQIPQLRQIPDINVWRPCDITELEVAWKSALSEKKPSCIILSKQTLPKQKNSSSEKSLSGGYLLETNKNYDATILATGSEIILAQEIAGRLKDKNIVINICSVPCTQNFQKQTEKYLKKIFEDKPVFALEATNDNFWYRYVKSGNFFGVFEYGMSGKGNDVYKKFFNAEKIALSIEKVLHQNKI